MPPTNPYCVMCCQPHRGSVPSLEPFYVPVGPIQPCDFEEGCGGIIREEGREQEWEGEGARMVSGGSLMCPVVYSRGTY